MSVTTPSPLPLTEHCDFFEILTKVSPSFRRLEEGIWSENYNENKSFRFTTDEVIKTNLKRRTLNRRKSCEIEKRKQRKVNSIWRHFLFDGYDVEFEFSSLIRRFQVENKWVDEIKLRLPSDK